MKIAVVTANIGGIDRQSRHVKQSLPFDSYKFTRRNFPLRKCAMSARMQARLVKTHAWQLAPDYDIYVWVDASFILAHSLSLEWLLDQLNKADMALFKHPDRYSIHSEADYTKDRIFHKMKYMYYRYKYELVDDLIRAIEADENYVDDRLLVSGFLIYRNTDRVRGMMKDWWYHVSRYSIQDQLSLPYVLSRNKCVVNIIPGHYLDCPYFKAVRYT